MSVTEEEYRQLLRKRPIGADPGPPSRLRRGAGTRQEAVGTTNAKGTKGRGYDPFVLLLEAAGLPAPELEVEFIEGRKFRADYLWRAPRKVILERQGGIYQGGGKGGTRTMGHSSVSGLLRDWEKSNLAQLAGYVYLQFTPQQLDTGTCLPELRILLSTEVRDLRKLAR